MQTNNPQDDPKTAQEALRAFAEALALSALHPDTRSALTAARARRSGDWSAAKQPNEQIPKSSNVLIQNGTRKAA